MVEISYDEYSEQADLAGRRVTEARHQYKPVFNIPDRAQAILNGRVVKKKLEPETLLDEGDELSFEVKTASKMPFFITAVMLALAITGGIFAYTYITASVTLTVTAATADYATVSANSTMSAWQPFGRYRGAIPAGNLFDVTPASGFTGDLEVDVYLSNLDELSENYSFFLMRLELVDSQDNTVDAQGAEKPLTLNNGVVQFYWKAEDYTAGTTYYIRNVGGVYMGLPWLTGWPGTYGPILFAHAKQAGL